MDGLSQHLKRLVVAAGVASTLMFGGCGGVDGVELNGKIFDWMGVSPAALEASRREPKLADRAPLVMPPDTNRLPDPGSAQPPPVDQASWPADPEQRKVAAAQERERQHLAYCRGDIQWKENALKSKNDVGTNRSPYGPCPSILGGVTNGVNKD